ncbi:MAG: hypothetical protein H6Q83_289 [Deltaproteobacteria bacterium]|nr:hypothetical protein [Deltaproteobacteria bacterium]
MNRFGTWVTLCVFTLALTAGSGALAFENKAGGGSEGAKAPASPEPIKVGKAKGADAYSVSETYEKAGTLDKKTVVVRGKVVKVSRGIMGKNWVHLRDGSGTAGKDNDITVTTGDKVAVGDVVTAKGTVRVDKDFGAGYAYPVIVEDAKLSK